jgi:hypothetical protein
VKLSSRAIADMCGVSPQTVINIQEPLSNLDNATVTTTDGRQYPAHRNSILLEDVSNKIEEPRSLDMDDEPDESCLETAAVSKQQLVQPHGGCAEVSWGTGEQEKRT